MCASQVLDTSRRLVRVLPRGGQRGQDSLENFVYGLCAPSEGRDHLVQAPKLLGAFLERDDVGFCVALLGHAAEVIT